MSLNRAIIHHTAGTYGNQSLSHSASVVRGVQSHHKSLGWLDVGYHFLTDALGNIFEGRRGGMAASTYYRGGHDSVNSNSHGFSALGNYQNNTFTTAGRNAMWDVIAWRMPSGWSPYGSGSYGGKTVGRTDGHLSVKATACPGTNIWATIGTNYSGGTARNAIAARRQGGGGGGPPPNGPQSTAMAVNADGTYLYIAQKKTDGALVVQRNHLESKAWSAQVSMGQPTWSTTAAPALVGLSDGRMMVVAVKEDGRLFTRLKSASGLVNEGWGAWVEHGLPSWSAGTGPAAVRQTNSNVTILAVKGDGRLFHRTYNPSTNSWGDFGEHGQPNWAPMARPCLIAGTDGRMHLIAVKQAGNIFSRSWTSGGGWTGWTEHGSPNWSHVGGISGVARANGQVTWGAVKLDSNFNMYHRTWDGSSWIGFTHHGADWSPYSTPAFATAGNRLYVFGTKANKSIYSRWWSNANGWTGWAWHGGDHSFYVGPAAISIPSGGLMLSRTKESSVLYTNRLVPLFDNFWWEDEVSHGDGWVK